MAAGKRKRFQLSSLPPEEKKRLAGYIKDLGGIFIDTQIFAKTVTHVVCGKPKRTEKYLGGCASGKWMLKKEFLEESHKQGCWISEAQYEWTSNDISAGSPKIPLYEAPRKWRTVLQNNGGAFKKWNVIVHMNDNKMKKAYERLLEAGDATVYKKKRALQDTSLHQNLTHVFTEANLRCDVQHFESKGVKLHSLEYIAEYIIEASKNVLEESKVTEKKNFRKISETPQVIKRSIKKEENVAVETRSIEQAGKRGVKRHATECDLCMAKRQKLMTEELPFVRVNSTQFARTGKQLVFPSYVANILEFCMDEGCFDHGMESVTSSLSRDQAPTSRWLHVIMDQVLLNAGTKDQALQSYHLLQNILEIHPPASYQDLYFDALEEHQKNASQSSDVSKSSAWDFVSKVIRTSLGENEEQESNSALLLKFLDTLFKLDFQPEQPSSILARVLWPVSESICSSNIEMKEFVSLCCESVKLTASDKTKFFVSDALLDMLSMAITFKKRENVAGQACESLAQQLFQKISGTGSYEATKLLVQGCNSSWLKMRIVELILENYDKRLVPQECKQMLNKTLTLKKIVSCYFFLLPIMKERDEIKEATEVKSTTPKKKKRKNGKGETPLHVACIHNNVAKVEELLKGENIDVNVSDNAGWTALHEASNHGHVQCVMKILQYHERSNKVDLLACAADDGVTVLHDAVVNNHLPVVKLLVQAGGLDLLQAKTRSGFTALQLSGNREMSNFIVSELKKLQSCQENLRPLPDAYDKVLLRNKRKQYVPMQDCEKYLFFVSQLVQVYFKQRILVLENDATDALAPNVKKFCTNCKLDVECCHNFSEHVGNLEQHIKLLSGEENLSQLSKLYITSMKFCIH